MTTVLSESGAFQNRDFLEAELSQKARIETGPHILHLLAQFYVAEAWMLPNNSIGVIDECLIVPKYPCENSTQEKSMFGRRSNDTEWVLENKKDVFSDKQRLFESKSLTNVGSNAVSPA